MYSEYKEIEGDDNMKKNEILKKIKELLCEMAPEKKNQIVDEETNLIHDLQFDSIMMMEFIVEIEDKFDIVIDGDDLDVKKISKLGFIIDMIYERSIDEK